MYLHMEWKILKWIFNSDKDVSVAVPMVCICSGTCK